MRDPSSRRGIDGLAEDFRDQRRLVGSSNEVYARALVHLEALLCGHSAEPAVVESLARAWKNREFMAYYERPLLLAAALRFSVLGGDGDHPLKSAFGPPFDPDAVTRRALALALDPRRLPLWLSLATRKVQTNDVSRSVAWRWPASLGGGRPVLLVDVGCSAGLNLVADALPPMWTDEHGVDLPIEPVEVVGRYGFDAEPIDLRQDQERQWLRACIWPGDHERLARLDAAMQAMATAGERGATPRLERVTARLVPARLRKLERSAPEHALVIVYQTLVREYLRRDEAAAYVEEMRRWLSELGPGRALWVQMELATDDARPPAQITVELPGSKVLHLARCSYHPHSLTIAHDAVIDLRAALHETSVARPEPRRP